MRLKYYIRGIGAGILLATILLSISFFFGGGYKNKELTDDEIIQRAEKLGMVMEEKESKEGDEEQSEESSENEEAESVDESLSEENQKPEEEMTIDEFVDEAEATNAAETKEDSTVSYQAFTVKGGQSSETIANNLYKQGLVDSASSFNEYLGELGVDNRIQSGTFYVQVGSSYDDIVALLVNKEARTTTPPEN
ncbi:MAG: endolytic transglycosylase MltG [Pseudobutyrivibrio sp.]|nr:endolytic transglycosylase MltG [Pseudobutyrivibrio sp.]